MSVSSPLASVKKLRIIDPDLKMPASTEFSKGTTGYLYLPAQDFPVHLESIRRLVEYGMQIGKPCGFVPTVPISSELGLRTFPVIAYWLPEIESLSLRERLNLFKKGNQNSSIENRALNYLQLHPAVTFNDTPLEEQKFYFVEHYDKLAPKPIQVSVIVTNSCNLKCVMCPYHSPDIRPTHGTDFFDTTTWMDWLLMEQIAEECGHNQIPIKIGNIEEPLLHPKIVDFISLCRSKGVPTCHITSNGLLLNEETGWKLLEAGLTSLYISIDAADPETYKRVRGANLDKVENNLKNFLKLREEMGKNCLVMVSFIRNEGVTAKEEEAFRKKWSQLTDGVIIYNLAEYVKGNARVSQLNEVTQSFMEKAGGRWACLNPWQEMYVLPDGRVYYCCETVSKLAHEHLISMGDYRQETLTDIWNGNVFKKLRTALLSNTLDEWSACKDCGIWMAHVCGQHETEDAKIVTNMMTEIFYKK